MVRTLNLYVGVNRVRTDETQLAEEPQFQI